jgi:hypothetical protein
MERFRRSFIVILLCTMSLTVTPTKDSYAVIPIATIIREGIKKVIKAVDLMIQRLQTKTIWLQNTQKVLENKLSELKLSEIGQWSEKQRQLYKEYYDDLWRVRNTISMYRRIRQILERQVQLVNEYKRTWHLVKADDHFTKSEIEYMYRVYAGILESSLYSLDQLMLITNSLKTQMSDAKRLEIISQAGEAIDTNYIDLKRFNAQNIRLILNRAKDAHEVETIKKLYDLN